MPVTDLKASFAIVKDIYCTGHSGYHCSTFTVHTLYYKHSTNHQNDCKVTPQFKASPYTHE
jgi:hypothetical protein